MPEGPELHLSSLFINRICRDLIFSGKVARNPIHKCAEINWDEPSYTISAESRGKELMVHLHALGDTKNICLNEKKKPTTCELTKPETRSISVLFTFGMSGKFEFTRANELLKHSHLTFFTKTNAGDEKDAGPMALSFVDYRRFGRWFQNTVWSKERGPCAIQEYDGFVKNVADNLDHRAFNRPICEVMLDQKFFSGIGNYLRAEILFRCKVAPFERASSVLKASKENGNNDENISTQSTTDTHSKNKKEKRAPPSDHEPEDGTRNSSCHSGIKPELSIGRELMHEIKKEQKDSNVENNESDSKDLKIMWNNFSQKGQEIMQLCHVVPLEVVQLGGVSSMEQNSMLSCSTCDEYTLKLCADVSRYVHLRRLGVKQNCLSSKKDKLDQSQKSRSTKYSLSELYQNSDNGSQSFNDWLQCYYKDGMKNLADHNNRTIWFTGPTGPLVPKEQKSRNRKTSSKKASKDKESAPKPKNRFENEDGWQWHAHLEVSSQSGRTKKSKGRLTRKELKVLENSEMKKKQPKSKRGKNKNTAISNGQEVPVTVVLDSKRKRKADVSDAKSNQATEKKKKKVSIDDTLSKKGCQRVTRSSLIIAH